MRDIKEQVRKEILKEHIEELEVLERELKDTYKKEKEQVRELRKKYNIEHLNPITVLTDLVELEDFKDLEKWEMILITKDLAFIMGQRKILKNLIGKLKEKIDTL